MANVHLPVGLQETLLVLPKKSKQELLPSESIAVQQQGAKAGLGEKMSPANMKFSSVKMPTAMQTERSQHQAYFIQELQMLGVISRGSAS